MCIGGTHYFTWSGGTTGNDPGPSLYCCCGSVKRGDADMMRIIAAQLAERDQQIAALREARDTLCECIHDVEPDDFRACGTCWLTLDSAILALLAPQAVDGFDSTAPRLRFDSAAATLAYLTADDDPAAAPDDEIRMPIHLGIPGVGVVVSAGPRPELVLEDDPPAGEEDTPA